MSDFALRLIIYLSSAFVLSFVLCLMIYRFPREKNVIKFEAVCPKCGEKASIWRFIPFFGYIFARGKYKCCDEKMSISRLLVPVFLLGLCALSIWIVDADFADFDKLFPKNFENASAYLEAHRILLCLFSAIMLVVIFSDFETFIIPDTCHIVTIILGILAIVFKMTSVLSGILGGVIFFVSFFVIQRIAIRLTQNEDALGGGDVKLMGVCGLFLGADKCLLGLLIGAFSAFLIEGILILLKVKKRGEGVAFGPYLAIGMIIAAFVGNFILGSWYNLLQIG